MRRETGEATLEFRAPETPEPMRWEALIDTAGETGLAAAGVEIAVDRPFTLEARSLALFANRQAGS